MEKRTYYGWFLIGIGIFVLGFSVILLLDYVGSIVNNGHPNVMQVFIPFIIGLSMIIFPIYYKLK